MSWQRRRRHSSRYLLLDRFDDPRAAGAINGTKATDGKNTRKVTDTGNKLTISGGMLVVGETKETWGDPGLWYPFLTARAGLILLARANWPIFNDSEIGWDENQVGQLAVKVVSEGSGGPRWGFPFNNPDVGPGAAGVDFDIAIILRNPGSMLLLRGGGLYSKWTLMAVHSSHPSNASLCPAYTQRYGTINLKYMAVPDALWLPSPLLSDSFNRADGALGTSDGAGHAESTGVGSGGSGVAWTSSVGTVQVSSNKAMATALDGGIAIATADVGTPHHWARAKLTRGTGIVGVVLRYSDASNYVYCIHNGTNVQMVKVVGGTPTTLVNAAATYSAGALLEAWMDSTKARVFYSGALIGTEQTIADAGLQTGTRVGLYFDNTSDSADDFTSYARGAEGQFEILNQFVPRGE